MSHPVYYVEAGDTLPVLFTTYDGGTGASATLTGLAVTDIEIYKDGSVTQRSSDAGYALIDTDGIDIDSTTGLHGFTIDLSDDTDSGFYAVGSWYHVVVNAVTVDSQTVVFIACAFRIVSATRGMAGTALPNAAADAAGGLPISDAGGLDLDAQIGTDIDAILVDTGTTLQGELDGIQADTEDIQSRIPAALVGGRIDATVDGTGLESGAAAVIADAVWDEDATGHQTGGTFGQAIGDPGANTETMYDAVVTDAAGTNVAADIIAVKAETASILTDTAEIGTAGAGLTEAGGDGDHLTTLATQTSVNTIDDFLDTEIAAIKAKTDQLTFTVANQVDANALTLDEDEILDDALADSVPSDGSLPTVRQALYMIVQFLYERSVSGTTVTVNKVDGSTSLLTLTLDDATSPTSITRAT